jgi:2-polyprenyl-6-methoxyphenol hydroxylase-like FAD-dependent oxidoreductase
MSLKVIISGAGIGGLALAHWLGRIGATTILVERAPSFQALGHYMYAEPYPIGSVCSILPEPISVLSV